ncbi:hypothetical protein EGH24_10285 [Halonotius terrestris]|uniref:Uncharacterized protein n=1 Tax=Halonotius terrestris TaxID=2487750 RepID=A0A8J8TC65_9EURY|nr:hypothetical protein [Halonotius terrestris]TQQ79867.1 hypothetical protein EGH24_10285 [Halonotius terrestris]
MQRTLREAGPGLLVPLAWLVVGAAHRGVVSERSVFIAHLVMVGFIAFFLTTGWREMDDRVLRGWRAIIVVGLVITALGAAGFVVESLATPLWTISLGGWMLLPAIGLTYTGLLLPEATKIYIGSATVTVVGASGYLMAAAGGIELLGLAGIAAVGLGQTIGILDAVARY